MPFAPAFYDRPTLQVARDLLGARLVRLEPQGGVTSGWIVETEAYIGEQDQACHGRHGRTERNRPMWGPAGTSYVYFTYGMHWLVNAVTEAEGLPAAVLVRAIVPERGLERIRRRRSGRPESHLTDGPAKLCQALAIDGSHSDLNLWQPDSPVQIVPGIEVPDRLVTRGPRVGLNNPPEPWRSMPWRLQVSRADLEQCLQTEGEL